VLILLAEKALGLLPAPAHRAGLRLAHALRKRWWRWRRPQVEGVRIIAVNDAGHVLLVRHSYGPPVWMPPGGGIKPGEAPVACALREMAEEIGCTLARPLQVDTIRDTLHGAGNTVHVVAGLCVGAPVPDMREIVAVGFFAPDALPAPLATGLADRMAAWASLAPQGGSE